MTFALPVTQYQARGWLPQVLTYRHLVLKMKFLSFSGLINKKQSTPQTPKVFAETANGVGMIIPI
jgi:hypothetical protein